MGRAGTAQPCATHTALSRILKLNSADSPLISLGLQNTLHSSIQFLAIPFWVKHLPTPWKYNSSSVQFLHGILPFQYQIRTALILHSLPSLANCHSKPPFFSSKHLHTNYSFSPTTKNLPALDAASFTTKPHFCSNRNCDCHAPACHCRSSFVVLWHMAQGGACEHTAATGFCFGNMSKVLNKWIRKDQEDKEDPVSQFKRTFWKCL